MAVSLPMPSIGPPPDTYGHARMPAPGSAPVPEKIDRIEYGRFRNVYVYITEACQLRCSGCYMGDRLERALKMPFEQIQSTLTSWRQMGGSKLTVLGGEPTLHPRYEDTIRLANVLGYEHVITTSNGLAPARRKFERLESADFAYVQISLDGGSATTHDAVRGKGKFDETLVTVKELCERGFDTRIICTVSKRNERDCLRLLDLADEIGVSLVKYHVLSVIGRGHGSPEDGMEPRSGWSSATVCARRLRATGPGSGISRPSRAARTCRGSRPRDTGAASAAPWTESRSSRTGGPTCAPSCSTLTCTSPRCARAGSN